MNSAKYVSDLIEKLKAQGLALMLIAWEVAKACVGWAYVFGAAGEYCTPENRRKYYASKGEAHPTIKTKCKNFEGTGSCSGCKWFPGGLLTRFFDCRGFTRWVLKVVFGWTLQGGGCTSQWNTETNWKAKGEIKDGIPQNVLCCLFYYKKDSKGNRTKTLEHTGFYLNGETVECSNGVQCSKTLNKKWEVWAVPACVDAAVDPITPSEPQKEPEKEQTTVNKTIRKGNMGELVKQCQTMLKSLGYDLGICGVDGDFGAATEKAVRAFQRDHQLAVDGVVGKNTWTALQRAVDALQSSSHVVYYDVTILHLTESEADAVVDKYPNSRKEIEKG